jgi:predicted amidohydrolase
MRLSCAVLQLQSTPDVVANLDAAERGVRQAAQSGAGLVVLPEAFAYIGPYGQPIPCAEALDGSGPILSRFQCTARERQVELILGGLHERSADGQRPYLSCVHVRTDGAVAAVYRKIHLFDADLPDGTQHRESQRLVAGDTVVVTQTRFGPLGLSICYDLRFPELYRRQVEQGAVALAVPSAFTAATGQDHWEVLLRARAIESQAYVLAAAQVGEHYPGRSSYGHAMIVDPWGRIIAQVAAPEEGMALAELDPQLVAEVRSTFPALRHRRVI